MNRYHRSYLEGFQHWCWHLCCNGLRNSWDDPFPRPACARDKRAELSWDKDLTVYISAPIWGRIIRWYLSLPFSYSRIGWIPDTVFLLHPALAPCETMFYWPMVPLQYQRIPIGYSKPGITITFKLLPSYSIGTRQPVLPLGNQLEVITIEYTLKQLHLCQHQQCWNHHG